jgi:hypothetical protein
MSKSTSEKFLRIVRLEVARVIGTGAEKGIVVEELTNVVRLRLPLGRGAVEFLCGPPEYHAEMFVIVPCSTGKNDRYDLAKLMSIQEVRDWFMANRASRSGGDRLESETTKLADLLAFLRGLKEFQELAVN